MVLERLAFHFGDRIQLVLRRGAVLHQLADFVLHETGQLNVELRIGVTDGLQHPAQVILVEFGQFREPVVGEQVGEFLRLSGVRLFIYRNEVAADQ